MGQGTLQETESLIAGQEIIFLLLLLLLLLLFGGQHFTTFFTRTPVGESSLHPHVYFDEIRFSVVVMSAPMFPTRSSPLQAYQSVSVYIYNLSYALSMPCLGHAASFYHLSNIFCRIGLIRPCLYRIIYKIRCNMA